MYEVELWVLLDYLRAQKCAHANTLDNALKELTVTFFINPAVKEKGNFEYSQSTCHESTRNI